MKVDLTDLIFEKLGVKPYEEFMVIGIAYKYRISKKLQMELLNLENCWEKSNPTLLGEILNGTYKIIKFPKLSEIDRKARDYFVAIGMSWVAKDADNSVFAYFEKPIRSNNGWYLKDGLSLVDSQCFKFLSWEDEEPTDLRTLE